MKTCNTEIGRKKNFPGILPKTTRQKCIVCPKCGARNYKYRVDFEYRYTTDEVNPNWEKGICFKPDCGGELK